ncbi:hypothetical protein PF005_g528 [Phytophthora fragariae]|uniref:Secreted protein n=1 Tax=Phytophthora fragariae TaxID=53985 RepID=A0A6A3G041_9STRA|nr:hypothetical protein PF003_g10015 [Phytophthora fragariae]KAE8949930.1 hypothetical protein PF009_g534 [Phytophthora fragariae]KAE9139755.1 hypothetical protein PF010_g486 [Phytophthora fragariae]KAE9140767.1 hypothetical protein PF007_g537 [Phytophthora fragariae]KAE9155701.1 hypothetical protein PF006_g368 [Phytophthora fragariae]
MSCLLGVRGILFVECIQLVTCLFCLCTSTVVRQCCACPKSGWSSVLNSLAPRRSVPIW